MRLRPTDPLTRSPERGSSHSTIGGGSFPGKNPGTVQQMDAFGQGSATGFMEQPRLPGRLEAVTADHVEEGHVGPGCEQFGGGGCMGEGAGDGDPLGVGWQERGEQGQPVAIVLDDEETDRRLSGVGSGGHGMYSP